jgi:uroporphyrinogen-III synthase
MTDNKHSILSTQSLSQELVAKAAEEGLAIHILPFIDKTPILTEDLKKKISRLTESSIHVAFTSQYALEIIIGQLAGRIPPWTIYTTGPVTSRMVERYFGASAIAAIAASASDLANSIIASGNISDIVFFSGKQRRNTLPERLAAQQIRVDEIAVYDTVASSQKIAEHFDGIFFFSPSAVHSFFAEHTVPDGSLLFAIGKTTSSAIAAYWKGEIMLGASPDKEQLIQQAIDYFHNKPIGHSGEIQD